MESTGLNKKSTFENLKIDRSDLAVMASKAIIEQPFSRMYHLLHAIGNEFVRLYPKKAVIFTTGKKILSDLKKLSATECFKKYHGYSVMLIDGVDEIVLYDERVENFVVLLEKLYSRNSQIVFTAGEEEKVIQAVARRVMRDKFAMGMMVGIHG